MVTEADFILVHHGHFDHVGDVPYIARTRVITPTHLEPTVIR